MIRVRVEARPVCNKILKVGAVPQGSSPDGPQLGQGLRDAYRDDAVIDGGACGLYREVHARPPPGEAMSSQEATMRHIIADRDWCE